MNYDTLPPQKGLDYKAILNSSLRHFAWWLIMALTVSFLGYPGVICVTPMAWLLALRVGVKCISQTNTREPSRRLIEAALAGGLLGLLEGVLFVVVLPLMGPITSSEYKRASGLIIIMLIGGGWITAALAFVTAYLSENKTGRST